MSSPDTVIAALRSEYDLLAQQVAVFSDDDLAGPSAASEWDISQVLSHLGSGAEINRATLQAALDGTAPGGREFNESVWDRWNAMSRRERADGFVVANRELTELYESLDADTRKSLRIDMGFLPAPIDVATAGRMRLNEVAMHSWDIRAASDVNATLTPQAVRELLHGEPDLTAWISKPEHLDGESLVLHVTTSEPESDFALNLTTPVSTGFEVADKYDGTLTLPAEAWLRLKAGRLAPRHTPTGIVTTGAADLDLLRKVFPGY